MKTINLLKSTVVELNFNFNGDEGILSVQSLGRTFSTKNTDEALKAFHAEVERLREIALKLVEAKSTRPWQNVISRFTKK
jgi:hypothetical protein